MLPTRSCPQGNPLPLRFILVLAALAAAAPAWAATYFVSTSGSDLNSGLTSASAWATVSHANARLMAGDVCVLMAGSHAGTINPSNSGTPTARITYLGNLADPGSVSVPSIGLAASYVSVKGVHTTTDGATFSYTSETRSARNDSIAWCAIDGGASFVGAKYCMMAHNTIHGSITFIFDHWIALPPAVSNSEFDTLRANVIDHGNIGDIADMRAFKMRGSTQRCLVDSNQVSGVFNGANADQFGRLLYYSYSNTFRDNRWTWEAANDRSNGEPWDTYSLRDSCRGNLFERDTMLCGVNGTYGVRARFTSAGNTGGTVKSNVWRNCVIKTSAYVWCQDAMDSSVVEGCTLVSRDSWALWGMSSFANVTFRHNTFVTGGQTAIRIDDTQPGGNVFDSNIVYAGLAPGCPGATATFRYGTGLTSDHNLFYSPAGVSPAGNAISLAGICSPPGGAGSWATETGQDTHSRFGTPAFMDSSFGAFNPVPRNGSFAIGTGTGGSTAGAAASSVAAPMVTAVVDLAATALSDRVVTLTWTTPGVNAPTGLDVRWSTQPIAASAFASASPFADLPAPTPPGTLQTFVATGLTPNTTYYFAVRVADGAGSWTSPSNAASAHTAATDKTPPAAIGTLRSR